MLTRFVHITFITLVHRILNKLTPDNFEKLSFELARHAGINNKEILKGAILLVSLICIVVACTMSVCEVSVRAEF